MSRIRLEPVRGMRDILPNESYGIAKLIDAFRDIAISYGYEYVITPTIELFDLFAAKSGPEIARSMYVFKDKAGREVCLRPEFTASIARIYLKYLRAKPKPIKLFYFGQVFRYEEPQFGRYREFFQAGVEYIGEPSEKADIELLLMIRDYYKKVGLREYKVRIGSVGIIRELLSIWGISEEEQDLIIHFIDKRLEDEVVKALRKYEKADADMIIQLMQCKVNDPDKIVDEAKSIGIIDMSSRIASEVEKLSKIALAARSLGINVYTDLGFARGLAYYTGFIFEVEVPGVSFSIAGGGRYDKLISIYGGPETPATGFSIGIDRSYIAISKQVGEIVTDISSRKRVLIISLIDDPVRIDEIASRLRDQGYVVSTKYTTIKKVANELSYASKMLFDYAVIVGPKEIKEGKVTVKNLSIRKQVSIDLDMLDKGIPI